jgi:hypothetical protein
MKVAWHEMPWRPATTGTRPVGYGVTVGRPKACALRLCVGVRRSANLARSAKFAYFVMNCGARYPQIIPYPTGQVPLGRFPGISCHATFI